MLCLAITGLLQDPPVCPHLLLPAAWSQKLAETPLQPLVEKLEENESLHRGKESGLGEPGLERSGAGRKEVDQQDAAPLR